MRSQVEIQSKITEISRILNGKKDHPLFYQYQVLVFKLYWENAKQYLKVEDQTEERREAWKKTSSLELKDLKAEIFEQLDIAAMHVQGKAKVEAMLCTLILLAQFWLLGTKKDKALKAIWADFSNPAIVDLIYEPIFISIANELQINWDRLKLRYTEKEHSSILDAAGSPILRDKESNET